MTKRQNKQNTDMKNFGQSLILSTQKTDWCVELSKFVAWSNQWIICVCIDGVKVSSCFHTGFFLVKNLRPLSDKVLTATDDVATAQADFDTFVSDFCDTYVDVLPMRTEFVKAIYEVDDKEAFGTACINQLSSQPALNTWYDPIDPLSSITS